MDDLKDILASGNDNGKSPLSDELLLAYMEGRLPPEERHRVELLLAEEGMESDALEGLQDLDADAVAQDVAKINHQLRRQLLSKKKPRNTYSPDKWTLIAIIVILLLAIAAYAIIRIGMQR